MEKYVKVGLVVVGVHCKKAGGHGTDEEGAIS